jgi:hypothetical protein
MRPDSARDIISLPPALPLHGVEEFSSEPISFHASAQEQEAFRIFLREFATMNLIPWMEKTTLDWSELVKPFIPYRYPTTFHFFQFPTRKLTSRLFLSTKRLFGNSPSQSSPPPSQHETQNSVQNTPKLNTASAILQRRMAEFATVLGDYKFALAAWDSLIKEARMGMVNFSFLIAWCSPYGNSIRRLYLYSPQTFQIQ